MTYLQPTEDGCNSAQGKQTIRDHARRVSRRTPMRTTLLAAMAALSLASLPAFAGEANNEPFGQPNFGAVTITNPAATADTGSAAYRSFAGHGGVVMAEGRLIQPNGSQAEVATANSLPKGFSDGTAAYAQAQSVQRYLQAQIARHYAERAQRNG
jgi:hypothetical protein